MATSLLNESVLSKKTEMYAMITAIESDFIENLNDKLRLNDIPENIIQKSNKVEDENDKLLAVLRGLDIQAYIEICNANITKLNLNIESKDFINKNLKKIIPIRNAVMHPRPLGFYDYPDLKHAFECISQNIPVFSWDNVSRTTNQIKDDPDSLLPPPSSLKKSNKIIENLPLLVDYEETSFIGRKKEIGEIKAQLNRRNVNILSIIGDGGVGKTALTLKLLYELLDDDNCNFELIIWASLKTNELSNDDFVEIGDSITSVSDMYTKLSPFVGADSTQDAKQWIIELAKNFNTLFVLDNLETINTADIKDFFDQFSEYGKVLITSRIGLGEMEHRYKLNGLNDEDVLQYTDTLLSLYGFECLYTNEQKEHIIKEELHSNPLAIKWFIRCLYNGQNTKEILEHKDDVINFCMANVYDKLSNTAQEILNTLTVAGTELTFPEIMYYLECSTDDNIEINYAINELGKCNFISEEKFKLEKSIAVTDFAKEFLKLRFSLVKHLLPKFKEKEQILKSFGQQIQILRSQDKYNIKSITFSEKGELVTAYYLYQALKFRHSDLKKSLGFVEHAKTLMPTYFECSLVSAAVYGPTSPLKSTEEYKLAIKYCHDEKDRVRVYMRYADFLIRSNDYYGAIDILIKAENIEPQSLDIKFEKVKVLSCIGNYDEADHILDTIEQENLNNSDFNKLLTKRADILKRRSELIDYRETQQRLALLKKAFDYLEKYKDPDTLLIDYMAIILESATHLSSDNDSLDFILEKVSKYYPMIKKSVKYRIFKTTLNDKKDQITNQIFWNSMNRYIINYNECMHLLKDNEALVYNLKEGYGFCKNDYYPLGIYFSMSGLPQSINYGDIIGYSAVTVTKSGPMVINPYYICNIDERL